jgi:hypothetical protein
MNQDEIIEITTLAIDRHFSIVWVVPKCSLVAKCVCQCVQIRHKTELYLAVKCFCCFPVLFLLNFFVDYFERQFFCCGEFLSMQISLRNDNWDVCA